MLAGLRAASSRQASAAVARAVAGRALAPTASRFYGTAVDDKLIRIVEVSARDGLQNIPPPAVPTPVKTELINKLLDCGLKTIEVGSFVRPDRVPQVDWCLCNGNTRWQTRRRCSPACVR